MSRLHPYFQVGSIHRLDNAIPSLHTHYRRFSATADGSAPDPCIGILPRGVRHLSFPFTAKIRFSRSVLKPISSSCRLYTGCRLSSKQVALRLIRGAARAPRFDSVSFLSMSHWRFAFAHLLDTYLPPSRNGFSRVAHHHAFWTQQHAVVWSLSLRGPISVFVTHQAGEFPERSSLRQKSPPDSPTRHFSSSSPGWGAPRDAQQSRQSSSPRGSLPGPLAP